MAKLRAYTNCNYPVYRPKELQTQTSITRFRKYSIYSYATNTIVLQYFIKGKAEKRTIELEIAHTHVLLSINLVRQSYKILSVRDPYSYYPYRQRYKICFVKRL